MLSRQLRDSKTPTACKELETQSPPRQWTHARLSTPCEVVPVVERIIAEMSALGYSERDIFCMRLAIEEAIVNGLLHGNKNDPAKQVRVRYQVRSDHVLTEVEDEGDGFDPHGVPDPTAMENLDKSSGRGLLLIEHYATWVRYNPSGNRVTLCKCRSVTLTT